MKKSIPTLSADGYVTDPKKIMSYLFAHLHEVRLDDSNIYRGNINSIASIIADVGNDPDAFVSRLRSELNTAFSRFFDEVSIDIDVVDREETRFSVKIDLSATLEGKSYSLGQLLSIDPTTAASRLIEEINR